MKEPKSTSGLNDVDLKSLRLSSDLINSWYNQESHNRQQLSLAQILGLKAPRSSGSDPSLGSGHSAGVGPDDEARGKTFRGRGGDFRLQDQQVLVMRV